jgi:gamma-glutamyltranspeptidase/glutathione hydrolase
MAAHGGFVTAQDLALYQAEDSEVGRGTFAGATLIGSYLPASGVTVIEIVQIVDRLAPDPADEGAWASVMAEALLAGFEDRERAEADRDGEDAVAWLTSDSLADRRAQEIADRLRRVGAGENRTEQGVSPLAVDHGLEPAFTTHVSVADTFGNAVALSQSVGPTLGAKVVTPGLGFVYASTLGGYLAGSRPGYPVLVAGSTGRGVEHGFPGRALPPGHRGCGIEAHPVGAGIHAHPSPARRRDA